MSTRDHDPKRFSELLGQVLEAAPPMGAVNERGKPAVYPGRKNRCCGALVRDKHGRDLRHACNDDAMPGYGLCAACHGLEEDVRRAARVAREEAAKGLDGKTGARGRWER